MKNLSLAEIVIFVVAAALPTYLLRFKIGPIPMTVLEVLILLAIVALVIEQLLLTKSSPHGAGVKTFLTKIKDENCLLAVGSGLILIATIIGIIVSPQKAAALGIAKAYFWEPMLLTLLIIFSNPDRQKIWRAAFYGLALSATVVAVYGIVQYIFPSLIPATWTAERRITSVFNFPNAVALYLAPLVGLFLSWSYNEFENQTPLKWIGIIVSGLSVIAIVLAKSAGGLIAVLCSLFVLGVYHKKTRIGSIVLALIVATVVMFAPQGASLREQILMRDWSGRVHKIGWEESVNMLKDNPIWGAGLAGYPTVVAPYHTAQGVEIFQYPHNIILAIWSELGLLGILGSACIIIWFFRKAYVLRSKFYVLTIVVAMIAILVHGLVDVPYFKNDLSMMFWLFIILLAS